MPSVSTYDEVLQEIGGFGKWQRWVKNKKKKKTCHFPQIIIAFYLKIIY